MHNRDSRYYILPSAPPRDERVAVLKHENTFAVFDRFGDIHGEHGLFHEDTRYVSEWVMRLGGRSPLLLSSLTHDTGAVLSVSLTNPDMEIGGVPLARGTLHFQRQTFLWKGTSHEQLRTYHYGDTPLTLRLRLSFDADFADIFEVRGMRRSARGRVLEPVRDGSSVLIRYEGLDDRTRALRLSSSENTFEVRRHELEFVLSLLPGHERDLYLALACEAGSGRGKAGGSRASHERAAQELLGRERRERCQIQTSSARFNEWIQRCQNDLDMLTTDTPLGPYPYAGVPWFSTAFGRDALITALETLWLDPPMTRGVLRYLAATQCQEYDPIRAAAPGKILHETRRGEMANLGEVPFGRYYGSVDATPLFVLLAGAYYEATCDRVLIEEIWPAVERAVSWMEQSGDLDQDGFIEYASDPAGLWHQGWKDSADSVFHDDGVDAEGPIALCEVQGYAFEAYRSAAALARHLGQPKRARELESLAEELAERFEAKFWCAELGTYALALDGQKRPCRVRSSNAGHCLFAGVVSRERAAVLAETLLEERSFSGWGVRTVPRGEARYNPMSYHNGSIWPHDNALIGAGLARYGYRQQALRILLGLYEASLHFETHRLPELFCGFPRTPGGRPTVYPVACSPQAWAAGAPLLLLKACLGLHIDAPQQRVVFSHPVLPTFLQELRIERLQVGAHTVDLILHRYPDDVGIRVVRRSGPVEVVNIK